MSVLRVVDYTRKLLSVKVETLKNEQKVSVRVDSLSLQLLLDRINERRLLRTLIGGARFREVPIIGL